MTDEHPQPDDAPPPEPTADDFAPRTVDAASGDGASSVDRTPHEDAVAPVTGGVWWDRAVLTLWLLGATALAVVVAMQTLQQQEQRRAELRDVEPEPISVRTQTVQPRTYPIRLHGQGFTAPLDTRILAFESPGRVASTVKEGATLDPEGVLAQLVLEPFTNRRIQAEADLARATTVHADATREVARIEPLVASGSAKQIQLDDARSALSVAAQVLVAAQAALDEAMRLERMTTLRSPHAAVGCVVHRLYAKAGQVVNAGEPIAEVRVLNPLKLKVDVSEVAYLTLLRARDPGPQPPGAGDGVARDGGGITLALRCRADLGPAAGGLDPLYRDLPAQLTRIGREADAITRRYHLELEIAHPAGLIAVGMHVDVTIEIPAIAPEIRIPRSALLPDDNRDSQRRRVFIVRSAQDDNAVGDDEGRSFGIVDERAITIEPIAGDPLLVRVTSGLQNGDRLLAAPPPDLQQDQRVEIAR